MKRKKNALHFLDHDWYDSQREMFWNAWAVLSIVFVRSSLVIAWGVACNTDVRQIKIQEKYNNNNEQYE